ncbi:hypothetical protein OC835_002937 [Tilletia horrida]|nr:hypothetical protein OC835_002937 [Tilletia horrida]
MSLLPAPPPSSPAAALVAAGNFARNLTWPPRIRRQREFKDLTWDDGIAAASTTITLFNEVADLVPVAGEPLKMALGIIREVFAIVQQVKDNKSDCESFAVRVMETIHEFAIAAKAAGRPINPGSAAAPLLEPFIRCLTSFHNDIQAYAALSTVRRTLKRDEIKANLARYNDNLNYELIKLAAKGSIVQVIRSDFEVMQAQAPGACPSREPSRSPVIEVVDDGGLNVQNELQTVSRALCIEMARRGTTDQRGANDDTIKTPATRREQPFTSEETQQLRELEDQVKRMFLSGDGEVLGDILAESDADASEGDQGDKDPAQSAITLIEDLCKDTEDATTSKVLRQLLHLSESLRVLALLDESVMVLQVLTALCRRNVSRKGFATDRINLAAAITSLSVGLFLLGRQDEALACSEEATTLFKQMADRQP